MIDEKTYENKVIELFEEIGYRYISSQSMLEKRKGLDATILYDELEDSVKLINKNISQSDINAIIDKVKRMDNANLFLGNKNALQAMSEGIKVENLKDEITYTYQIIDFDNLENNSFIITDQLKIISSHYTYENQVPDLLVYINGLPVSVIELKSPILDESKSIEDAISNINEQVNLIKEILINKYNLSNSSREYFCKYIKFHTNNYSNQTEYLATNAIGEFTVDYSKTQDIKSDRPSRADLTPEPNSIIISKLDGENKVLYIPRKFSYVVSTGFFNFSTEYLDHVVGFLLSEDYKKQKTMLATGTTMMGLNSDGLNQIKFKSSTDNSSSLTVYLNKLLNIKAELDDQKRTIIRLLIR